MMGSSRNLVLNDQKRQMHMHPLLQQLSLTCPFFNLVYIGWVGEDHTDTNQRFCNNVAFLALSL